MTGGVEDRSGRLTALGVTALALAATVAVLVPTPAPARAAAVLCFAFLGPGAAIAALLRVRSIAPWTMVTLTGSVASVALATEFAVLTGWWQPRELVTVLAAASAVAALVAWRRDLDLTTHQDGERTCTS